MNIYKIRLDNFKITANNTDVVTNVPTAPVQAANANNLIKAGIVAVSSDEDQTFTFDTPFTGTAADIVVVLTPNVSGFQNTIPVVSTTLTGFTVNRNNSISGTITCSYIAINIGATSIEVGDV